VFDTAGQNFYPGVTGNWNYVQGAQNYYNWLDTYIGDNRAIVASFHVPDSDYGDYDHDLSVWGWDPVAHLIYVTDGDDGITGLRTYSFSTDASGNVTILGYTNPYTDPVNVQISRLVRLNLNDPFVEPSHGTGGGDATVPEPGSMLLLGTGLAGLFLARKRFRRV
jgi:hypothetical protein